MAAFKQHFYIKLIQFASHSLTHVINYHARCMKGAGDHTDSSVISGLCAQPATSERDLLLCWVFFLSDTLYKDKLGPIYMKTVFFLKRKTSSSVLRECCLNDRRVEDSAKMTENFVVCMVG